MLSWLRVLAFSVPEIVLIAMETNTLRKDLEICFRLPDSAIHQWKLSR